MPEPRVMIVFTDVDGVFHEHEILLSELDQLVDRALLYVYTLRDPDGARSGPEIEDSEGTSPPV